MDPERFLTAAVQLYNRIVLLVRDVEERQKSAEARKKFEEVEPPALGNINYYVEARGTVRRAWSKKDCGKGFLNGGQSFSAF
jgi:hypothetical protein